MKWCTKWSLVLRAVMSESFADNECVGTWWVWAEWRGRFSPCPRLYPGGVVLGVSRHNPKAETEIFTPVSDLLHCLGHQLMSSAALQFSFIYWLIDRFFSWFTRFSSIATIIDEAGFCKGIHNVILGCVALWLSYYSMVSAYRPFLQLCSCLV